MLAFRESDRLVEVGGGVVEVPAQQVDPPEHRQGECLPPRLPCRLGQPDRLHEQGDGLRVVALLAFHRAQVGRGFCGHRERTRGVRQGVGQPPLRAVVTGAEEVHIPQFRTGVCQLVGQTVLAGDLVRFVEPGQPLLVQTTQGVDVGLAHGKPGRDPPGRGRGVVGQADRPLEPGHAGVEGTRRQCRRTGLDERFDGGRVRGLQSLIP